MKEIEIFEQGNNAPLKKWIDSIDNSIKRRIVARIKKMEEEDYYGDYKIIDSEIKELRFKFGSGYRIYFHETNDIIILLLCGGDKATQQKDIQKAREYLKIWREQKYDK
ncbi:MAG: type II toxin-antitoxin system RelE/ParE family toxin [Candidatus Gastranaerophilales bacterium]|nr:type II toxin-antitoxin system RelE/ParE family toxin [Candidatus Gastranaerophilales bacterium]